MAEEIRFHLEQRAADLTADGVAADEAALAAQRRFGNTASIQEQARETFGWGWLLRLGKDFQLAARHLAKAPGFTSLAVITLALGIGANTSMFSVINGIVLKPLPYFNTPQLDRIYRVSAQTKEGNIAPADFLDLRSSAEGYGDIAAYSNVPVSLAEAGLPADTAECAEITPNLIPLLGIPPRLGRNFRQEEQVPGRDRVVILSHRLWHNRFGASPDIIGRSVRIDGEPHLIVGVMPESFNDWRHLGWIDLFRPLVLTGERAADRHSTSLRVIGRRSATRLRAETDGFVANFGTELANRYPESNAGTTWRAVSLHDAVVDRSGPESLAMLIGLSGFVLLIACSNLANLLLARAMARAREFSVRAALGASRVQLLRPLIIESLLLSLLGGAGAILVGLWVHDWFAIRSTADNGEQVSFVMDWSVVAWAFSASLFTAMALGLAPALFALRLDLNGTLKSGARGATGGRGHQRFRQVLIVGQFALAMILLTGAGLFIRSLDDLNSRRAGWESTHLITGSIVLPSAHYADATKITAFHRLTLARLAALPGVASASVSSFTPFFNWADSRKYVVEGREMPEHGHEPLAAVNTVSPLYFSTVGTRLVAGRLFGENDSASSTRVLVISQATATGLFGGENPLGRRLGQVQDDGFRWGEIVGVVSDLRSVEPNPGLVHYQVYQPMSQEPLRQNELEVRTAGVTPGAVIDAIRTTMSELDPDLPVQNLKPADLTIVRANYQLGVLRDMLSAFAVLGLGLATMGIYGIITRTMAQRTAEFAIRLALGASAEEIVRLVLGSGVKLALTGAALGLLGALGVLKLLSASFPGMQLGSPSVIAGTTVLLVVVALTACWLPARRAGRVDAIQSLRDQ